MEKVQEGGRTSVHRRERGEGDQVGCLMCLEKKKKCRSEVKEKTYRVSDCRGGKKRKATASGLDGLEEDVD